MNLGQTKSVTSLNLSDLLSRQLRDLVSWTGENQSKVFQKAVDRMWRDEKRYQEERQLKLSP